MKKKMDMDRGRFAPGDHSAVGFETGWRNWKGRINKSIG
jgi:hypothetical protein